MNDTKLRAALKEALHEVNGMMVELAGAGIDEHILKEAREAGLAASMAVMDIALDLAAPVLPPAPIAPVRQPLTDAMVQKIVITVCDSIYPQGNASYSEADSVFYGAFARAIEAEHGIK